MFLLAYLTIKLNPKKQKSWNVMLYTVRLDYNIVSIEAFGTCKHGMEVGAAGC